MIGIELGFRVFAGPLHYHRGRSLHFDAEMGFRELPGLNRRSIDEFGIFPYRLNSDGFRGRGIPAADASKPGGVTRIAFLGDSFLMGWAVREEHLMTAVTERILADAGRAAEVYNLSSHDYGTFQELLLLRKYGGRLAPDVVVLAFYPHNDIVNNSLELAGRTTRSDGDYLRPYVEIEGDRGPRVRYAHPGRAFLRRISRGFGALERRVLSLGVSRDIEWLKPWPPGRRMQPGEYFREHTPGHPWERGWEATFDLLRLARDEAEALGARFLVLVIPSIMQVQRDATGIQLDLEAKRAIDRPIDQFFDWNLPERRLVEFFRTEAIDTRLLLDPLREATTPDSRVYGWEAHLSWKGHAIAGQEVADWFLGNPSQQGVLTPGPTALLPDPSRAVAWLDFQVDDYEEYLVSDGWGLWTSVPPGREVGWMTSPQAALVLPARVGDLVVRGRVPPQAKLPLPVELGLRWGPRERFALKSHGPFEIRLPNPLPNANAEVPRYVLVDIESGVSFRAPKGDFGLFVSALGFAPAGS